MRLTRKFLTAFKIDGDIADEIINAHVETVDALKEQRDQYKADAEKLKSVEKELKELKEASEGQDGTNPFEVKYNDLKKEFDTFKESVEKEKADATKKSAYRKLLVNAGVSEKVIDDVLKITDINELELDENNNLKNEKDVADKIKDKFGSFIETTKKVGGKAPNPPNNVGGKVPMTKEDIVKIEDSAERKKAWAEHPELITQLTGRGN